MWSPDAPGTVERLDTPLTEADAQRHASEHASATGDAFGPTRQFPSKRRRAHAAAYSSYCTGSADAPYITNISGSHYHAHALSHQSCVNVGIHGLATDIYVGSSYKSSDGESGGNNTSITTNAWTDCYTSASPHNWWNWSDFHAVSRDGAFVQGPIGFFIYVTRHCL
jgi:hypothetical protein